jgi:tyrosyl-tRNA synthetase
MSEIEREVARQIGLMREGAAGLYGEEELRPRLAEALRAGRPLRVKLGVDPSAPDLHLGHAVVLQKLRRLQDLGHQPVFLVGDFTARIGDPSGRKKTRPALSAEEVARNAATYVDQVGCILDVARAEIRFNGEWMEKMSSAELVRLCSQYTVARLLERDDFAKRYAGGEPIAVHELLYPLLQAWDSVALRADIELGGTDQTFNLLLGREIQRAYGQPPQAVIVQPLLVGTDGREKMSKSLGNAIGLAEPPEELYGKVMSLSDELMLGYFDLLEGGQWPELRPERERLRAGSGDPLAFKHALAGRLVERFQGGEAARRAAEHFRSVIQRKEVPDDLPETPVALGAGGRLGLLALLVRLGLARSHSEARRLVEQGAVQVGGAPVADPGLELGPGACLIKVGKRRFARVRLG